MEAEDAKNLQKSGWKLVKWRVEWSFNHTELILTVPCKAGNTGRALGCIRGQAIGTHRVLSDIW